MNQKRIVDFCLISFLILFAYSGMIKWLFVPIDPTLFFSFLCLPVIILWSNFKFYYRPNPLINIIPLFFLFNILIVLTAVYTISDNYYIFKSFLILSNTLAFVFPLLILRSKIAFKYFSILFKVLLFFCLVLLLFEYADNQFTRIRYREELSQNEIGLPNYLTFSYFLGTCVILLIDSNERFVKGMLLVAILFMILLAAKGPLLFLILTMGIKFRKKIRLSNLKFWFSFGFVALLFYLIVEFTGLQLFDTLINRLSFFSGGLDADESSLARVMLLWKGIELISENLFFGVGIGGYAKGIGDPDGRLSPHNIFIEVWAETGLIPTIILILICVLYFIKFRYLLRKYQFQLGENIIYLCLFIFLSNMVSSYLEDMRLTYFWLGTSVAYYTMRIKTISNEL